MKFSEAKLEMKQLLGRVDPSELPRLINWIQGSDEIEELLSDNSRALLRSIADDLRGRLPPSAMLPSETTLHSKMQRLGRPTLHVDSFLYEEDQVDSLCQAGTLSRSFCLSCGSHRTAPLDFISHSFSISELQFIFQKVLPDLNGCVLVDVGSRLGAVLYGGLRSRLLFQSIELKKEPSLVLGYVFSSATQLIGLEISEEFVKLQEDIVEKYQLTDRIKVLHTDVCLQQALLHNTDVLIMNNVFEFFMEPAEQARAWSVVMQNFRKRGSLLLSVPSLHESLKTLQMVLQPGWVEELPVDSDAYLDRHTDPDSLTQIHLYRVL